MANSLWYKHGLRFKCTECGKCCTGSPGYTWLQPEEILSIANALGLEVEVFAERYLRQVGDRYALKEHPKTFDCVFLEGKQCQIYSERPVQCRTFPFWPDHLESKENWEKASEYCEGISESAELIPEEEVAKQLSLQEAKGCF